MAFSRQPKLFMDTRIEIEICITATNVAARIAVWMTNIGRNQDVGSIEVLSDRLLPRSRIDRADHIRAVHSGVLAAVGSNERGARIVGEIDGLAALHRVDDRERPAAEERVNNTRHTGAESAGMA